MSARDKPFFIGYLPAPKALRPFLWGVSTVLIAAAAALGFWMGTAQDDPGDGAFRFDYGRQTVTGIEALPPKAACSPAGCGAPSLRPSSC